ncbi:hypothetical protein EVAR_5097_1 [Eumeta japonica]|uniref:Uncharacterized protein n=1 Tax=Eumeta variegata TaxID=151549 RepID=A0A4C1SV70_EUMVA|nr:hypothetical protein EVAR_5097_1 [Eumeta japonica]
MGLERRTIPGSEQLVVPETRSDVRRGDEDSDEGGRGRCDERGWGGAEAKLKVRRQSDCVYMTNYNGLIIRKYVSECIRVTVAGQCGSSLSFDSDVAVKLSPGSRYPARRWAWVGAAACLCVALCAAAGGAALAALASAARERAKRRPLLVTNALVAKTQPKTLFEHDVCSSTTSVPARRSPVELERLPFS